MNRSANLGLLVLAGAVAAALAFFGTGLNPVWPLLWQAPVPVIAIAPRFHGGAAFLLAAVAWLLGELNQWTYFTHVLGVPVFVTLVFLLIPAIVFGVGVLFARRFLRRQSLALGALAFPVYWVTWEYLNAISSPHSTFGNLAYTQMGCLPVIQIASITGIWGVSFIIFLFAGSAGALLSGLGNSRERRALAITVGVILCLVILFGEWRLLRSPAANPITVTLMAKDVPMSVYLGDEAQALQLLREYANEVRRLTPGATQVVVLPEKIARVSEKVLPEVDALFSAAASATKSAIDLGLVRRTGSGGFNSSRFYSPDGPLTANYDKHHLVPGIEPETPGSKRVVLNQPSGHWGLQICKDMDFPRLSREYANDGANLLLVPAWDFNLDRWLHARMAVLRGVENGFALARCARNGLLTLADNRGRILAEAASAPDRFVSITDRLPAPLEKTFYARAGDWFAWICVATFILLLIIGLWPARTPASRTVTK